MSIIVQKFGGSSVASVERIRRVARRVAETRSQARQVVVVVSAMGSTTNELLGLARTLAPDPDRRELDVLLSSGERISMALLAMTLHQMGVPAISLTGPQAGIRTNDEHFNAEIVEVAPGRIRAELAADRVVIVAGYQGLSSAGEVTTLGRGGSDTTAVALASALEAGCEIYSDVDGIYTADPRVVPSARRIDRICHDEMLAMARLGAKVLSARAIAYARRFRLGVRARCTFDRKPGTLVCAASHDRALDIAGVAGHREVVRIRVQDPGDLAAVREQVMPGLFLERDRELLVASAQLSDPGGTLERLGARYGDRLDVVAGLGSVSAVGKAGVEPERANGLLAGAGLTPVATFAEPLAVTCLVRTGEVASGLCALHEALIDAAEAGAEEGAA